MAAFLAGLALFFAGAPPRGDRDRPAAGQRAGRGQQLHRGLDDDGPALAEKGRSGDAAGAVVLGNLMAFASPFPLRCRGRRPADAAILAFLGVFQIGLAYTLVLRAFAVCPRSRLRCSCWWSRC